MPDETGAAAQPGRQSAASERRISIKSSRFTCNVCTCYLFSLNSLGRKQLIYFVTWRYSEIVLLYNLRIKDFEFDFVLHNCTLFHVASNMSIIFAFSQKEIKKLSLLVAHSDSRKIYTPELNCHIYEKKGEEER